MGAVVLGVIAVLIVLASAVIILFAVLATQKRRTLSHHRGGFQGSGSGPQTAQAVAALLALQSVSMNARRLSENEVAFHVVSIEGTPGAQLGQYAYSLELEIVVRLNEPKRKFSFITHTLESGGAVMGHDPATHGWSIRRESFRGIQRVKIRGKWMQLNGMEIISFDSGKVYAAIEDTLRPLGWSRGW